MKAMHINLGNDNSRIAAFKPFGTNCEENRVPNVFSRNYVNSLPVTRYATFDAKQSWYKYSTQNNDNKKVISKNTDNVIQNNTINK